jgi:pimeloyl-ACP methyl ester carboxylesterase
VLAADAAALAVESPAHVVGASMGAAIAVEMALAFPERVRSLTLITPAVEVGGRLETVLDAWCRLAAESSAATLAMMLLPWMFAAGVLDDRRARDRMRRGLEAIVARVPRVVLERHADGLRSWSGSRNADLARIAAPTLVLVGADDILTPGGERVAEAIGDARCVVIADAGHALALEAPDAVNEAIAAHLSACR